jgi:D-sedoheptulose 7-phosphate isomerase
VPAASRGRARREAGPDSIEPPPVIAGSSTRECSLDYIERFLDETAAIAGRLDRGAIGRVVTHLVALRNRGGRLFVLGVGGSAANAAHAVNDFRKLCGIEAYAPTDNVAELTARINDEGWERSLTGWLEVSRLGARDAVLVLSVGGGDIERGISVNVVRALELARRAGAVIIGIVGGEGGATAEMADACVLVPGASPDTAAAHAEAFQEVVWHLLVSHPMLQRAPARGARVR